MGWSGAVDWMSLRLQVISNHLLQYPSPLSLLISAYNQIATINIYMTFISSLDVLTNGDLQF